MLQKPKHLAPKYGAQFKDRSIVDAYRHRPPYPAEIFTILAELINGEPQHVLDVGCGTGNLSRYLVERSERLDAVDFSLPMLEQGKQLPNGNHPRLRWLHGSIDEIALDPPYALVTAGESLHWMDWKSVLPRFRELLIPGGYLAIVEHDTLPDPWYAVLREIIPHYSTNQDFHSSDNTMLETLEQHGLFQKVPRVAQRAASKLCSAERPHKGIGSHRLLAGGVGAVPPALVRRHIAPPARSLL